jgi:subtilisin family serine protease
MPHLRYRTLPLSLLVLIAAFAATTQPASPSHVASAYDAKVQPDVRVALAGESSIGVLVELRKPPAFTTSALDVARARSEVAAVQAQAVAGIAAPDLQVTYRYQAVAALAGRVTARGLAELAARPEVAQVTLDAVGTAALSQSVPMIHADDAHDAGITGAGVIVAVLDTGIDTGDPDLQNGIAYERCFLSGTGCAAGLHPAEDDNGHGTNVAGIITSDGIAAPEGVAPDAQIAAYKILDQDGSGLFSDWIAALDDIIANHPEVDIINMSLQSLASCPESPLSDAISTLRAQGVATFIASGNRGYKNALSAPACITEGISVGAVYDGNLGSVSGWKTQCTDATTQADQVPCWSSSDDTLDLLAPGARITSTGTGAGLSSYMGTSQAAPHAAGVAALLLQAVPGISLDEMESRMKLTGTIITDQLDDSDANSRRQTPRIDARVALITDLNADDDGDGCPNGKEFGPDEHDGGRRNPLNPWDYFNPTHDGENRVDDILAVVKQYNKNQYLPSPPNPAQTLNPDYTSATDRSPGGPNVWNLGPADGLQRLDDILAAVMQYGHFCQ